MDYSRAGTGLERLLPSAPPGAFLDVRTLERVALVLVAVVCGLVVGGAEVLRMISLGVSVGTIDLPASDTTIELATVSPSGLFSFVDVVILTNQAGDILVNQAGSTLVVAIPRTNVRLDIVDLGA